MPSESELERALADAGGADAPREWAARLRELLRAELERGAREMGEARSGRERPVALAVAGLPDLVVTVLPLPPELRADASAVAERGASLASAAVECLVDAAEPGGPHSGDDLALLLGACDGFLALSYPAADARLSAEYTREALPRLGGSPLDEDAVERLEPELLRLLEPAGRATRAHDDPDPRRRAMRRILQRLDGMGKWGGYHTAFDHLARGFAGNDRALAFEVGEELLNVGLLSEKPSVGQRHVSLNPRKAGEIRNLIDEGALPPGLRAR